ncbi:hypothetical protein Hdeb2414_s0011g00370751 [Helianthus debilis subsp. tardiflorus]
MLFPAAAKRTGGGEVGGSVSVRILVQVQLKCLSSGSRLGHQSTILARVRDSVRCRVRYTTPVSVVHLQF